MILFYLILLLCLSLIIANDLDYSKCACGKMSITPKLNEVARITKETSILGFIGTFYYRNKIRRTIRSNPKLKESEKLARNTEHVFYEFISTVTLLNQDFVLTTANAAESNLKWTNAEIHEHYVAFGSNHNLQRITKDDPYFKAIGSFYIHPRYDSVTLENNLAILEVKESFPLGLSLNIFGACLYGKLNPFTSSVVYGNLYLAGYGYEYWKSGEQLNMLKVIKVEYVADRNCLNDDKICVVNNAVGTCDTDEGSPLLWFDGFSLKVIGINDWSAKCVKGSIIQFTPVYRHDSFLERHVCKIPFLIEHKDKYCRCRKLESKSRVINGTNVIGDDFQFFAAFYQIIKKFIPTPPPNYEQLKSYKYFCGGSLINSNYILTSAHCLVRLKAELEKDWKQFYENYGVAVGGKLDHKFHKFSKIIENEENNNRKIMEIIIYPLYDSTDFSNDIALARVDEEFLFGKITKISPVCLFESAETEFNKGYYKYEDELYIAGYGKTSTVIKERSKEALVESDNLRFITTRQVECVQKFEETNRLCFANDDRETKTTPCLGDSGAGVFWFNKTTNKLSLIAVYSGNLADYNSTHSNNCPTNTQSYSFLIYPYLNWIKKYINYDMCSDLS